MPIEWDWYRLQWARYWCRKLDHKPTTIHDPVNPGFMVRCCERCGKEL